MKKLERNQMKDLKGGVVAPPPGATYGQCSSTTTCQNGSTITQSCEGWNVSCVGLDYGTPMGGGPLNTSHGYSYCSTTSFSGGIIVQNMSCPAS